MAKPPAPTLSKLAVINDDGSRNHVHPADVKGRFNRVKPFVHFVLVAIYVVLPWVKVGGRPAVLVDIPAREFSFFGLVYNAQDFYLAFFVLTGIGFSLFLVSALWGRIWCGWACPHTVFLEGFYRRVERWIDGPREARIKLAKGPWTAEKVRKRVLKHGIYIVLSLVIAHIFLSYFVSLPRVFEMVRQAPGENLTPFLWVTVITGIIYFNFFWFREQLCLIICPYGRLQSSLGDKDTWIIGYDTQRGEPRGKKSDPNAGDCIDCRRCVTVCPTGIDIRNGLQMECIGCANCIDACDEVMLKIGREPGLVRYDTYRGLEGETRQFWRPRVFAYMFLGVLGLSVATYVFSHKTSFEANVLRVTGAPYVIDQDTLRNQIMVHVINKHSEDVTFLLDPCDGTPGVRITMPQRKVTLKPLASHHVPAVIETPRTGYKRGAVQACIDVTDVAAGSGRQLTIEVLGP